MVADANQRRVRTEARNRLELECLRSIPGFNEAMIIDPDGGRMASCLTAKERIVVGCIADAMRNADVAAELSVSVETVKRHLSTICNKLGMDTRTEIAVAVYRRPALRLAVPIPSLLQEAVCL